MPLFGLSASHTVFGPEHPGWHDPSKPAGHTSLLKDDSTGFGYHSTQGWWVPIVKLHALFLSPNLVWLVISLAMYLGLPYNLEAEGGPKDGFAASWVLPRFAINCSVTMAYVGYWYVSLYHLSFAARKFKPEKRPSFGRMCHNMWYTFLGAFQWSVWEVIFMRLWATGALPYISDTAALADPTTMAKVLFWVVAIPVFREFHFYWAHRMLHFRVLYRFVHSLHHRNVDPEPFSGLCMHPVEHLYYLATVLPSIALTLSPFHFLWNGIHAVISPAAGHSGWEDHWQSDQHHYIHHATFESNYGGGGIPVDAFFGTLRDTLSGKDRLYVGAASGAEAATLLAEAGPTETAFSIASTSARARSSKRASRSPSPSKRKSKSAAAKAFAAGYELPKLSSLNPLPKFQDACYMIGYLSIFATLGMALFCTEGGDVYADSAACQTIGLPLLSMMDNLAPTLDHRTLLPLLVAFGPVAWGFLCNALLGDKFSIFWPFHKEPWLRTLFHFAMGTAFCQAVVFQSLALYFRSPYTLPLPVLQQSMGLHGGTDGSA